MFTGIIQEKVPIRALIFKKIAKKDDATIDSEELSCVLKIESKHPQRRTWNLGDSLALDGACLTIVSLEHGADSSMFSFDVSQETLTCTHWEESFEDFKSGKLLRLKELHLEPALKMGEALGGHLVSGHVEGVATLEAKSQVKDSEYIEITFSLLRESASAAFLIEKGSVALDGTSLTLNRVWDEQSHGQLRTYFTVCFIPLTLEKCHFALLNVGDVVNIESDMMARHFCRYQEVKR